METTTVEDQKKAAESFLDDLDVDHQNQTGIILPKDDKTGVKIEAKVEDKIEDKLDDKIELELKREPRQAKPGKDESIATLRKQRDESNQKLEVFTKSFGDHNPEAIKPLLDFIVEEADGPITTEYVTEKISSLKSSIAEIDRLKKELEEKESTISTLDIKESKEFKDGYETPYKEAMSELFLEFATVADDKTIVAPKATKAFNDYLVGNPELTGIEIKAALLKFSKEYNAESGEEAILPSINSIMSSYRKFNLKRHELQKAYTNWKETKKNKEQQDAVHNQIQTEAQKKQSKKMRTELASKAYREFDLESMPFVTEKEAEEMFREEFAFGENIIGGENVPGWDTLFQRGVKSRLFDKYLPKLVELLELEAAVERGERNGVVSKGRRSDGTKAGTIDWLTGEAAVK